MNLRRILTGMELTLKMLLRRKIVLILILIIPVFFLSIVSFTSTQNIIPFELASIEDGIILQMTEEKISFVFFAVASAGFLTSFLALNLIQKNRLANKRLIICGYHPVEILTCILISLLIILILIAVYITLLTGFFFPIMHPLLFIISLCLIGFVYGSYGLLAGSIVKDELEGILLIVLLVNIDVGWLQNPIFYSSAENQFLIKSLPGYYPSQAAIITGFTNYSIFDPGVKGLIYGLCFLLIAIIIFFFKMRIR